MASGFGRPEDPRDPDEGAEPVSGAPDGGDQAPATPPTGKSPMGFGGTSSGPGRSDSGDDAGPPDFAELLRQLTGSGEMPDLEQIMRQLGGSGGGMPDLGAIMSQLGAGGPGGGMPDLAEMMRQLGVTPPGAGGAPMGAFAAMQQQLAGLFTPQTPQSRVEMATDVARKTVAGSDSDPSVTDAQRREVADAVRVAQLWIDPVTAFDAPMGTGVAWSRAEWVEATMPTWAGLVEPISAGVTRAVSAALRQQMGKLTDNLPEGFADQLPDALKANLPGGAGGGFDFSALLDQVAPAMEQLSGSMFTAQLGQGVGALASDMLSGTEVGLPLVPSEDVALLPSSVAAFTEGLGVEASQVLLYLAVREGARARLFAEVPWLRPQLEATVRDYAANIDIDTDAIEEQVRDMEAPDSPEGFAQLQEALQHKLFSPTPTPEQQATLTRLETSLALVEGWVDLVTDQATQAHLPQSVALGEAVRRRRAGGPAQKAFSALVGLELRPRRLRDARNLWAALESSGGIGLRDGAWSHPDISPRTEDLDDPMGYVEKRRGGGAGDDVDSALEELLREAEADGSPDGPDTPRDHDGPAA
ncbi:MAG: zinc-dependent metalloprotease [Actinomycetota bacterium]|nr:zinc-dependent metalloprotease [Actinomycetota bacterium]